MMHLTSRFSLIWKEMVGLVIALHEYERVAIGLKKEVEMLNWAIIFFIVALVAAILGFSGVAIAAAGVAKILFFLFLILFVISLLAGLARRA